MVGFTFGGTYGHVPLAYTSFDTWQQLLYGDDADGRFSAVAIGDGDAEALAEASPRRRGPSCMTKTEAYAGSPGFSAESATMTLIRGFLLVISALVVGAFFTVWTIQRTRQIGLLKALGASSGYVVRDAMGQLAIVLVIAITIGAAAAFAMGRPHRRRRAVQPAHRVGPVDRRRSWGWSAWPAASSRCDGSPRSTRPSHYRRESEQCWSSPTSP